MEGIKESLLIGYPSMIPYESHKTINEQMERYICKLYIGKTFLKYHFQMKIICYLYL